MPTLKPRLAVTFNPPQFEILRRFATLQGIPMSRALMQFLDEVFPTLETIVVTLEAAKAATGEQRARILAAAVRMNDDLGAVNAHLGAQTDLFSRSVAQATGEQSERSERVPLSSKPKRRVRDGKKPRRASRATARGN